jgi:hypothetical protein
MDIDIIRTAIDAMGMKVVIVEAYPEADPPFERALTGTVRGLSDIGGVPHIHVSMPGFENDHCVSIHNIRRLEIAEYQS